MDLRVACAAMVMAAGLAGCTAEGFEAAEAPTLQSGFSYAFDGEFAFSASGRIGYGGETEEFDEQEEAGPGPVGSMEILSTRVPHGRTPMYVGAFGLDWDMDGKTDDETPLGLRQSDLAPFAASLEHERVCQELCTMAPTGLTFSDTTPIDPYLDFPLTAGKQWQSTVHLADGADDGMPELKMTSTVKGPQSVEVADRSVEAVRVERHLQTAALQAFKQKAVQEMREEGFRDVSLQFNVDLTVTLDYAPQLKAAARETVEAALDLRASFVDPDGERVDVELHLEGRASVWISGVDLTPAPDRDLAEVLDRFAGETGPPALVEEPVPPVEPRGEFRAPSDEVTLRLSANRTGVDAARNGEVSFRTVVEEGELPVGAKLHHAIHHAKREAILEGTGPRFAADLQEPGQYYALVEARDRDGALLAYDSLAVSADYVSGGPVSCPPAVTVLTSCDTVPVPMRAGVHALQVSVQSDGAAGLAPPEGELVLRDGRGGEVRASAEDGEATIRLDRFDELSVHGDDWALRWEPPASALEEASWSVALDAGAGYARLDAAPESGAGARTVPESMGALQGVPEPLSSLQGLPGLAGLGSLVPAGPPQPALAAPGAPVF